MPVQVALAFGRVVGVANKKAQLPSFLQIILVNLGSKGVECGIFNNLEVTSRLSSGLLVCGV